MAKVSLRNYNREIESMIDQGRLDEAIAHCRHILKTFPKHLETYRLLGKAYLEYKRHNDAVDVFMRVLAAEPNDFVANVGISIIRDEENKLDDAIWHMERAFEIQPSNPAIQAELQRLYARRDGVQPPRIRMTRGALAHMYVQGELYPQAISEIKSVLKDDPGRNDMQVLLARAYYRSGQKNDAADAANSVLRRYPYCLDANRVLVEILGADRSENVQTYRQRVIELDPYAAQVDGTIFQSSEVGDNAVALERLEWDGQPVTAKSEWGTAKAVGAESRASLQDGVAEAAPPPPKPTVVPPLPAVTSPFDIPAPAVSEAQESVPAAVPTSEEDIPDFLRAAGWGKSTGAFDESKPGFDEEPASAGAGAVLEGDLPDWVKAMKPQESPLAAESPSTPPAEEEELPDWIMNIGTGAISATAVASVVEQPDWLNAPEEPSAVVVPTPEEQLDWSKDIEKPAQPLSTEEQPDWLKELEQPVEPAATDDLLDWLKGLDQPVPAESTSAAEQPDWLKELEQPVEPAQPVVTDDSLDWLKGLDQPAPAVEPTLAAEQPDWLKELEQPVEPAQPVATDDSLDWLKGLDQPVPVESTSAAEQPDWLKELEQPVEPAQPAASVESVDWLKTPVEPVTSETAPAPADEFDWLEGVGEPEPASATPAMEQPDWLTQFGSEPPVPVVEEAPAPAKSEINPPTGPHDRPTAPPFPALDVASLGKTDRERDDSFAWLEALAAKQGASEGLLTKPEERLQEEPEWIKQAKGIIAPEAAEPATIQQPPEVVEPPVIPATVEELGKSEQERDDSFAWLEALAAKQGASEGLLTKPEDRLQEEPEWIKQAKGTAAAPELAEPVATQQPPEVIESPVAPAAVEELGKSEQERDDSFAWLEALAANQGASEGLLTKPEERLQEEPDWIKQAQGETPAPTAGQSAVLEPPTKPTKRTEDLGKSEQERDDSFAWLEALAAKQGATEGLLTKPEERLHEEPDWVKEAKGAPQEPVMEELPSITPAATAKAEELGKSQQEIDDSLAWLESLAAKQGATEGLLTKPEERLDEEPDWVKQAKSAAQEPAEPEPVSSVEDTLEWFRSLEQGESEPEPEPGKDDTAMWLKSLDEPKTEPVPPVAPAAQENLPEWLRGLEEPAQAESAPAPVDATGLWLKGLTEPQPEPAEEVSDWLAAVEAEEKAPAAESAVPEMKEVGGEFDWLNEIEEESAASSAPVSEEENLPAWLKGVEEETHLPGTSPLSDLPGWMRDETGEVLAEPTKIEPTRQTDWRPVEEPQPELPVSLPYTPEPPKPEPVPEKPKPAPRKPKPAAEPKAEPYREPMTIRGTGMLSMPAADPALAFARNELSRSNIPGALEAYGKLIKKGRFLDEVIFDLRDALYRYPVEVSIWQSLGDAYMRSNRLQDALDAYTKAEELLR